MTYLGADIDTLTRVVRPILDKVREIPHISQALLDIGFLPPKHLQRVVGLMASCHVTVPMCLFHLIPISSHLARSFRWNSDSLSKRIPLNSPEVVEVLRLWSSPLSQIQGVTLGLPVPGQTLTADRVGAVLGEWKFSGRISPPCQSPGSHCGVLVSRLSSRVSSWFKQTTLHACPI